jgi:hypothetical protein
VSTVRIYRTTGPVEGEPHPDADAARAWLAAQGYVQRLSPNDWVLITDIAPGNLFAGIVADAQADWTPNFGAAARKAIDGI